MKIALVVNADTREGWLDPMTEIKNYGGNSLGGCRSIDFLTDGVINKQRFFRGYDIATMVYVDVSEIGDKRFPPPMKETTPEGIVTLLPVVADHSRHRFNDYIYIHALRHIPADCDYVAHFDGDAACFQRDGYDFIARALQWLDDGYAYVCQQTPLSKEEHGMSHASTRFFFCRRETLDLDEAERLLDDGYRVKRFGHVNLPCLEHILGAMCGGKVLYPPCDDQNFIFWNWVRYYRSTLAKLNAMPYDDILKFVEQCGGVHGASDLVGTPI